MWMVDCTGTVTAFLFCDVEHKWHKAVIIATVSAFIIPDTCQRKA